MPLGTLTKKETSLSLHVRLRVPGTCGTILHLPPASKTRYESSREFLWINMLCGGFASGQCRAMAINRTMSPERTKSEVHPRKTWMIVERLENWRVDEANDFKFFGIPQRLEKRASEISRGDYFLVYVSSGVSAFADIREATESTLSRLRFGGDYDTAFPYSVATKPVLKLPRHQWIPIKGLISDLSFTRDKSDWRQIMRSSLRLLSQADADLIIKKMTEVDTNAT